MVTSFMSVLVLTCLCNAALAVKTQSADQSMGRARSLGRLRAIGAGMTNSSIIMSALKPEQAIIICNAFAWTHPLDVVHVQARRKMTANGPLKYKQCQKFVVALNEGDELEFTSDDVAVGVFRASDVPSSSSLLLIPHRRNRKSIAVSFKSHAFGGLSSAQLAVIDTYQGESNASIKIVDGGSAHPGHQEQLAFDSVVGVSPGNYSVVLGNAVKPQLASSMLAVSQHDHCVVVRVGNMGTGKNTIGDYFPQELLVFQQSSRSGCFKERIHIMTLALAAIAIYLRLG